MATELASMSQQFAGLPMGTLIGAPLKAACDSQVALAKATSDFIESVGFNENNELRTTSFTFMQNTTGADGKPVAQKMSLDVPLLAIVNIPSLAVKTVDITFDMEVKSSFSESETTDKKGSMEAKIGWGFFSAKISGSISSHKEQTRKSDNSAKYHVEVKARDDGMPEGLARVLDIVQNAISPVAAGDKKKE